MTNIELRYYEQMTHMANEISKKCSKIDWEQRRYEIAKELIARNPLSAKQAVEMADELITELQKSNNDGRIE